MAKPSVDVRAWTTLILFVAVLALMVFATAGSLNYWQGWAFLAAFTAPTVAMTADLLKNDPALAEKRMRGGPAAEGRGSQKVIQSFNFVLFLLLFLLPGLDHRFGWSSPPVWAEVAGVALILIGFWGLFRVMKVNPFASASVELAEGQTVTTTGPYRWVRHPMYAAGLMLIAGIPLSLGSLWGLVPAAALLVGIIWRLLDEERFLDANLPGYRGYRAKTRFRLVPGVF